MKRDVSCHPNVHVVPYSDHSSYQELEDFLSALQPLSIMPIVGTALPSFSAVFSPRKKRRKTVVPESVLRYMTTWPTPDTPPVHCPATGQAFRGTRSAPPRGVVFESPRRPRKVVPSDREASGAEDTDSTLNGSDCVLLDMEQGSIIDVESDVGLRLAEERSELSLRLAEERSELSLRLAEEGSELSPRLAEEGSQRSPRLAENGEEYDKRADVCPGSFHALHGRGDGATRTPAAPEGASQNRSASVHPDRCSSLEHISLHDNAFATASAATAVTPRNPSQPPLHSHASAEDSEKGEQWLLRNLVFPEEELSPGAEVVVGLGRIYNLRPLNTPKRVGDSFEAAIERFKAALR